MSVDSIRKKGYLYKLPVKGLVKKWSRRWFVLHGTTRTGVVRIEYFDNEGCEVTGEEKRTIPLRDCSSLSEMVGTKVHPYIFQFKTPIGQHVFASESQVDLDEWTDAIQEAVHEDRLLRKSQKQKVAKQKSKPSNVLERKTFTVTIEENETAKQMGLKGTFCLEVGPSTLSLVKAESHATVATWHYKHLKNFGKQTGQFYFEIGALPGSSTKPGYFVCLTTNYKEIFSAVNAKILLLRKNPVKQGATNTARPHPPSQLVQTVQHPQSTQTGTTPSQIDMPPAAAKQQPISIQHAQQATQPQDTASTSGASKSSVEPKPTLKYSVIQAGGRAAGRTSSMVKAENTANQEGIFDTYSFDSFESFDSFDDEDEGQQPITEVHNPLSTNTLETTETSDFDHNGHGPIDESDGVDSHPSSNLTQPTDTDTSNILSTSVTTGNPTAEPTSTQGGIADSDNTALGSENDLTVELDRLQNELEISNTTGACTDVSTGFETGFSEATINDIANFDLSLLLENSAVPDSVVGDINPEDFANLDLNALNTDFFQPIEPNVEMDTNVKLDSNN